jgi:hypothetical protein
MKMNQVINNEQIIPAETPVENGVKKAYSKPEKILLLVSLAIGVLFDRLMVSPIVDLQGFNSVRVFAGAFWLCWIAAFCAVYRKRLRKNITLWIVALFSAALCVWNFIFPEGNNEYGALVYLVIPAVLMAHVQMAAGGFGLKDAGQIGLAWISGWLIKPFSGIPVMFGAAGSLFRGGSRTAAKRAAIGAAITLALFLILIPLLSGADMMFGFYIDRMTDGFNLSPLIFHGAVVLIAFALFYSVLWNAGFGNNTVKPLAASFSIDKIICVMVLGAVALLYALFCGVQFTYLFAGAGLPEGMTYSAYAREGFSQTVTVCAINLAIFGVFLRFGAKSRVLNVLLGVLLGLTAVMLYSGAIRLYLYIGAYGLIWLRLLPAWFIIYLAAVLILCAVRMAKERLPVFALCAVLLLGWFAALGYSNPDRLIDDYNANAVNLSANHSSHG